MIELIERPPKIPATGLRTLAAFTGRIELERVMFSYPARPLVSVLNNMSFIVQPGKGLQAAEANVVVCCCTAYIFAMSQIVVC